MEFDVRHPDDALQSERVDPRRRSRFRSKEKVEVFTRSQGGGAPFDAGQKLKMLQKCINAYGQNLAVSWMPGIRQREAPVTTA